MAITLDALRAALNPSKTALVFGAGASVPSGAPTGAALASMLWERVARKDSQSDDLIETTTILERSNGRLPVAKCVRNILEPLTPSGGILGIPAYDWKEIFSTNFDLLIEKSYKQCGKSLTAIRSNYDLTYKEDRVGLTLYKIHGCVTQDRAFGDRASMILTEGDYEEYERFRQSLFSRLTESLLTGDVLVIGQSLRDRHLQDLVKRILIAKNDGAPGTLYVLVYDRDDLRAPILEDKGAVIVFGGIDDFVYSIGEISNDSDWADNSLTETFLSPALLASSYNISDKAASSTNVSRMFNGGSANYADIRERNTFDRAIFANAIESFDNDIRVVVILGAAGVGKTTFARQVAVYLSDNKFFYCWEHRNDFPFRHEGWISVEARLRSSGRNGLLILDECTRYLRSVNLLIEHLASIDKPALKILLTANAAQWAPRMKTPKLYATGSIYEMSKLNEAEISSLINLLERNKNIASLVNKSFKSMSRGKQQERLRLKCSADMFVCLKNIFANETLDTILLREYDDLDEVSQSYYRHVAALEAVGTRVHRQLILRMNALPADQVSFILTNLTGIVDEYPIKEDRGLYGWSTRHIVIARKITDYKYSGAEELIALFNSIIDAINPTEPVELRSIRDICDTEYGIGRIIDPKERVKIYRRLTVVAPAERIPWHRLIREMLDSKNIVDTEYMIRDAEEAVGADGPIDRYKARLFQLRAFETPGISEPDRLALLRKAYDKAVSNTDRHREDKQSYRLLCDISVELIHKGDSEAMLAESIDKLKMAYDRLLDPGMLQWIRQYEAKQARLR